MDAFTLLGLQKLGEAIAKGELDNLPGKGKPLPPDELAFVPTDLRMAYTVLKNSGCVPREVALLREIATLREQVDAAESQESAEAAEATLLRRRLRDLETEYKLLREQFRK
jgi:hypothetical protein